MRSRSASSASSSSPRLADPARREELLGGAAAGARGVFDFADGDKADGFAVLHGLYWLAVNLTAEGPAGARRRRRAVVRRCVVALPRLPRTSARDACRCWSLATVRSGEEPPDEDLLAELALEPEASSLRPAALSVEATAELVERRLDAPPAPLFIDACHRTTSGNPFLLASSCGPLPRTACGRMPPTPTGSWPWVHGRSRAWCCCGSADSPTDVAEVARAAAVLGDGASLPVVAALAGLAEDRTAEALAALARAEIVSDEQPLAFVHPLVRDAVYSRCRQPSGACVTSGRPRSSGPRGKRRAGRGTPAAGAAPR